MAEDFDTDDLRRRMEGAVASLKTEFNGLRTGRASVSLLDPITVDAYGATMPLNQVGNINVPEPRMISVQVWDRALVIAVEKAIRNSNLGVNPIVDGQTLRIPIPPLNEERRRDLAKLAGSYAEHARVAVRNVRRDGMETLKRLEKDGDISEDDREVYADEVQSLTDKTIEAVDAALQAKQEEIMQV